MATAGLHAILRLGNQVFAWCVRPIPRMGQMDPGGGIQTISASCPNTLLGIGAIENKSKEYVACTTVVHNRVNWTTYGPKSKPKRNTDGDIVFLYICGVILYMPQGYIHRWTNMCAGLRNPCCIAWWISSDESIFTSNNLYPNCIQQVFWGLTAISDPGGRQQWEECLGMNVCTYG